MPFARGSVRAPKTIEIAAVRSIAMLPVAQLIGEGRVMLSAVDREADPMAKERSRSEAPPHGRGASLKKPAGF